MVGPRAHCCSRMKKQRRPCWTLNLILLLVLTLMIQGLSMVTVHIPVGIVQKLNIFGSVSVSANAVHKISSSAQVVKRCVCAYLQDQTLGRWVTLGDSGIVGGEREKGEWPTRWRGKAQEPERVPSGLKRGYLRLTTENRSERRECAWMECGEEGRFERMTRRK